MVASKDLFTCPSLWEVPTMYPYYPGSTASSGVVPMGASLLPQWKMGEMHKCTVSCVM